MKHIRLFEEYKFFKARKDSDWETSLRTEIVEPTEEEPFFTKRNVYKNIKDPKEPFFNYNKHKYFSNLEKDNNDRASELNRPIKKEMLNKMGLSSEMFNKLQLYGKVKSDRPIFSKEHNYYSLSFLAPVQFSIRYFVPENDYLFVMSTSLSYSAAKKRFDNPEEGINWILSLIEGKTKKHREQLRDETIIDNPGVSCHHGRGC